MHHQRLFGIAGSIVALALLLACGSGASVPTITSPTAAGVVSPTSGAAPAAAAPTAVAAPTSAPEPTAVPAATVGKVGDRVELNGTALTVVKVSKADKIGTFQKAKAGNVFVLAEVVIENVDQDEIPYNPFYFKVKDADGFEYNAGISIADQSLKSGKLAKGDKARGIVLFEVKEGAAGLVMEYKPIRIGGGDAIKIALE